MIGALGCWLLAAAGLAAPAGSGTPAAEPEPTAQQLLDDVVAQLPQEPLDIVGDMILRKRHGIVLSEFRFRMELKWGAQPAWARYTIQDAFGHELDRLIVKRDRSGTGTFTYATGEGMTNAPLPDLSRAIRDTDMSWMDLTLSFLWWKGGEIKDRDSVKGRDCYVVEVPAPKGQGGQYAAVRLWIDCQLHLLMQAEGLNSSGQRVRILWVRSIRKINERWMIKDLEVQADPAHRTRIIIREVNGEKTGPAEASDTTDVVTPTPVETPAIEPVKP